MNFFKRLTTQAELDRLTDTRGGENIISSVNAVVSAFLGLLTAGVTILAIFIAYKFFTADDDTKRKNAKQQLIYAIIGIVVLIALMIFAPMVVSAVGDSLKNTTTN